jgi:hypothetical protein
MGRVRDCPRLTGARAFWLVVVGSLFTAACSTTLPLPAAPEPPVIRGVAFNAVESEAIMDRLTFEEGWRFVSTIFYSSIAGRTATRTGRYRQVGSVLYLTPFKTSRSEVIKTQSYQVSSGESGVQVLVPG